MKSTKPKLIKKRNKVITPDHREWTREQFESYREYQIRYTRENYRTFTCRLNRGKDAELIEWFESRENFAEYIRELGLKDMKEQKKGHKG